MIRGGSDMHSIYHYGGRGFVTLKVCQQCPLVLLKKEDRRQGDGMSTAGVRTVWDA